MTAMRHLLTTAVLMCYDASTCCNQQDVVEFLLEETPVGK